MLLYYITDRRQFAGNDREQRRRLLRAIRDAARCGVDFIQLRERDLMPRQLEALALDAAKLVRRANAARSQALTRLLINSRLDVALAAGADGVHLRSDDLPASEARALAAKAAHPALTSPLVAVSCHTAAEVRRAEAQGADFCVFAPVFEKTTVPQRSGVGLDALREACRVSAFATAVEGAGASRMPVLALGGVTLENAGACLSAGAAGIAAIRLFQSGDIANTVKRLRELSI